MLCGCAVFQRWGEEGGGVTMQRRTWWVKWGLCTADKHWSSVQRFAPTVGQSLLEAQRREKDEADTVSAMASLTVDTEPGTGQPPSR